MKHAAVLLASILLAAVIAVGVSAVDPPPAEAAGGGYVKKCGGGKIFLKAKEKRTFVLHNRIRRNRDLPTFCVHRDLQRAARFHSKEMIEEDYFSHYSKNGESFEQRLRRFGYRNYSAVGENIYGGSGANGRPGRAMRSWMNSDGHRANILKRAYRQIGIGTATGKYYSYTGWTMYTADFGAR